ncbi:MAG: LysR family transcriptional regulator [Pseudonocardiaceae bacterium]|nr:LysR family transcriptional regulator [Pseudonocardiaceae bacterium]
MDTRQLHTFLAVARGLNFTRAADTLGYAQSSVTAQIKTLEAELGAGLFDRHARRVTLTPAGERLVRYAEHIVRLADEACGAVRLLAEDATSRPLCIGASETLCTYRLPDVLRAARQRLPGLRISFRPAQRGELLDDLASGALDAAFLTEQPIQAPKLVTEASMPDPLCVVSSPDNPLATMDVVGPAELSGQPLLLLERGCSQREVFERQLAAAGVQQGQVMEFTSVEAVRRCAIAGLGVAALPTVAITGELERGELVVLGWPHEDFGLYTQVIRHRDRTLDPALTTLIDTAREFWTIPPGYRPSRPESAGATSI